MICGDCGKYNTMMFVKSTGVLWCYECKLKAQAVLEAITDIKIIVSHKDEDCDKSIDNLEEFLNEYKEKK